MSIRITTSDKVRELPAGFVRRRDLHCGDIYKNQTGQRYMALGNSHTFLAISAEGEFIDNIDGDTPAQKIGEFRFVTALDRQESREMSREELPHDALFRVGKSGAKLYANLGQMTDGRWASVDMGEPFADKYSATEKGEKNCVQVGTYHLEIAAIVAEGERKSSR